MAVTGKSACDRWKLAAYDMQGVFGLYNSDFAKTDDLCSKLIPVQILYHRSNSAIEVLLLAGGGSFKW